MSKPKKENTKVSAVDPFEEYGNPNYDQTKEEFEAYLEEISKPFDEAIIPEQEDEIEFMSPYKSELFQIHVTGNENQEYLESVAEMIDEYTTRLIKNPDQFIRMIRNKPSLILNDIVVQFTIRKLQRIIVADKRISTPFEKTGEEAINAIKILKDADISIFKPHNAPKRTNIVDNALYGWRENPEQFVSMVSITRQNIVEQVNEILKETGTKTRNPDKKVQIYKEAYERIYNRKLTDRLKKALERHSDGTTLIAVAFISRQYRVSPESAISLWKSSKIPSELKKSAIKYKPKIHWT